MSYARLERSAPLRLRKIARAIGDPTPWDYVPSAFLWHLKALSSKRRASKVELVRPLSLMGQPLTGQPLMGQPPTGQPLLGQLPTGQPLMGQPPIGQPLKGQPPLGQPLKGQPPIGQPLKGSLSRGSLP